MFKVYFVDFLLYFAKEMKYFDISEKKLSFFLNFQKYSECDGKKRQEWQFNSKI